MPFYFFTSCNNNVNLSGEWIDDHIDPDITTAVDKLNQQVVDGIVYKQPQKILAIRSDSLLLTAKDNLIHLVALASDVFSRSKFKIKNQFYVKNISEKAATSAVSGMTGDHDYKIAFQAMNKESLVVVGELEDSAQNFGIGYHIWPLW